MHGLLCGHGPVVDELRSLQHLEQAVPLRIDLQMHAMDGRGNMKALRTLVRLTRNKCIEKLKAGDVTTALMQRAVTKRAALSPARSIGSEFRPAKLQPKPSLPLPSTHPNVPAKMFHGSAAGLQDVVRNNLVLSDVAEAALKTRHHLHGRSK